MLQSRKNNADDNFLDPEFIHRILHEAASRATKRLRFFRVPFRSFN